ncbi:MAG: hypothetical protein HYV60_12640 [Planctomycetia bacterium]|nr:hypothetical protein [Planctomycetia bacterium]
MNSAIFWRLVWKEYRQQRALWTAIALAGLIFQVAVLVYCALNGVSDLPNKLFTVALSVPILYSLGCGATLFAGEHEADTFPFQQALPVAAGRVFTAKVVFALCSALALFPVLWLLAFAMTSWKLPDATWHLQLWGGGVVATIEVLVWALLSSLVLRRVLPAAVVSGVVAVLLGYSSLVSVRRLLPHAAVAELVRADRVSGCGQDRTTLVRRTSDGMVDTSARNTRQSGSINSRGQGYEYDSHAASAVAGVARVARDSILVRRWLLGTRLLVCALKKPGTVLGIHLCLTPVSGDCPGSKRILVGSAGTAVSLLCRARRAAQVDLALATTYQRRCVGRHCSVGRQHIAVRVPS